MRFFIVGAAFLGSFPLEGTDAKVVLYVQTTKLERSKTNEIMTTM